MNSSASALQAHSLAVEITGKNLANANNPGYAREIVNYSAGATVVTAQGAQSIGISATLSQVRDTLLDRQVLRESSLTSYYTTLQSAYQRAEAGLGQTISAAADPSTATDTGVGAALDDFFNAFQGLASSPTDTGAQQALLSSANILVDRLQQSDGSLAEAQSDLAVQAGGGVTDANTLLQTVATLNGQIARVESGNPGSAVDLRDQRQSALEQLAALLPVTVTDTGNGEVQVASADSSGTPVVLVSNATVTGPLAFTGTQVTGGTPASALVLSGGSIQGAIDASGGALQSLRDQLDALTKQLVTAVNAAYNPTGTTGDFFAAGGLTAGTVSLAGTLTAASLQAGDGSAAGDNSIATAVAQLAGRKFSTAAGDAVDGTLGASFSGSMTQFGQAIATVNSNVQNQGTIETMVRSQRDSVSGVNLDEETANLLKYQRSFEASSRVLQTIDSLLDEVVNRLMS